MEACGWLSVKQLVVYQSTVMVHKTLLTRKPYYLHSKLNMEYSYRTRQHTGGCVRQDNTFRGDLPRNSFRCRGVNSYNSIPAGIRASLTMATFKSKLKKWIRTNISLD